MPTKYVLPPEWEWPITIALFIAGIASGTYAAMGLIHFAGDKNDQPVAYRLGFIPLPLMLVVPLLLIIDLGQPGRFLNLLIKSPAAAERGGPLMFNSNSPMNWGSWAMVIGHSHSGGRTYLSGIRRLPRPRSQRSRPSGCAGRRQAR